MFGLLNANWKELDKIQQERYGSVYCGICRAIGERCSQVARVTLQYDMAFLALLLLSLYEPEEENHKIRCRMHPLRSRQITKNEIINYCADMNVALAYYKAQDDWEDEKKLSGKMISALLEKELEEIKSRYDRQCQAIENALKKLYEMEKAGCGNPDEPANAFGELMAELLVWREDLWTQDLKQMGMALGRFIYLADAAMDYRQDKRKNRYNPFIAMGCGEDYPRWEEYLVLIMGRCTHYYEKLPLVQDKKLLDNILYSGIWIHFRKHRVNGREYDG